MAIVINLLEEKNVIEINYFGKISKEDYFDSFTQSNTLSIEKEVYNIIADCTNIYGGYTIIDVYDYIIYLERFYAKFLHKVALIISTYAKVMCEVENIEQACSDRGYNVKLFDEKEIALKWLCS
jgi:hypothetical protein